jgi:hypothetical protein
MTKTRTFNVGRRGTETTEARKDHSHSHSFWIGLEGLKTWRFCFKNPNDFKPLFSLLFSLWDFLKIKSGGTD